MDVIVTEAGVVESPARAAGMTWASGASRASPLAWDEDPNSSTGAYASPPCFMHELDPSYLGLRQHPTPCPADPAAAGERDGTKDRGIAAPDATTKKTDDK
jgi:hypothetical protein